MIYLFALEAFIIFFVLWLVSFTIYFYTQYPKPKKSTLVSKYKKRGFFYKMLFQFPRAFGRDLALGSDKTHFHAHGLVLFEGVQGAGKTIAMTHFADELKQKFPDVLIYSNYGLSIEDGSLVSWEPMVGSSGLYLFDEISLWWSCRNYANFPPEMLRTIVQNRKESRLICGTCQQINMVDKQLRRQCTEVRKVRTIGAITIVWKFRPVFSGDGDIVKLLGKGIYWFVHTDYIRNLYDTYRVVENLKNIGFERGEKNER